MKSDLWEVKVGRTIKSEKLISWEEEEADSLKSLSCNMSIWVPHPASEKRQGMAAHIAVPALRTPRQEDPQLLLDIQSRLDLQVPYISLP